MTERPLPAASLRTRVLLAMLAVLAVTLVALVTTVGQIYTAQARRDVANLVTQRVGLAQQLVRTPIGPQALADRVSGRTLRVELLMPGGQRYEAGPEPERPGRPRTATLQGGRAAYEGATLTVTADLAQTNASAAAVQRALWLAAAAVLLLGGLLTWLATWFALRPLKQMAGSARRIAKGERGVRLRPTNPRTEIGATAIAVDGMLDELEGAELRARSAEQAAQGSAARMQSFLADAAHELRTPLAGIQAASEALLTESSPAERQQLELLLAREASRAGTMVSSLLDLARIDAGLDLTWGPVSLGGLLAAEAERVELAGPPVDVHRVGLADLEIVGDASRVAGALRNLVDNAIRYAAAGGPGGWIELGLGQDGNRAVLTVTDSGRGVPDHERERIFERMVRLRGEEAGSGSGLGLNIARGYARAHGGDVVCAPAETGRGARFVLTLPMRPDTGSAP